MLTVAFGAAMLLVGVTVQLLLGDAVGNVVFAACLAGGMFCVAGAFNVMWRMYWYVPQARATAWGRPMPVSRSGIEPSRRR
jgi:hypothetical protein